MKGRQIEIADIQCKITCCEAHKVIHVHFIVHICIYCIHTMTHFKCHIELEST